MKKKEQYYGSIEHHYFSEFIDDKGNSFSSNVVYFSLEYNEFQDNEPNGVLFINLQHLLDNAKKMDEIARENHEIVNFCSIVKDWINSDLFTTMMRESFGKRVNLDDLMVPIAVNQDYDGDFILRLRSAESMGDGITRGNEKQGNKIVKMCIFEPIRDGGYLDPENL
ncbi:MAG: hypothetical protein ACFFCS_04705 [Candidatus Hodarchaeota archaeon]